MDGHVVSMTARLIAIEEGSIAKVIPNEVWLTLPSELICTPLASAAQ